MGWLVMVQTSVGAVGYLVGCPPTVRAVQMLTAPTVWGGALS